jgi:hypothetical protein
VALSQVLRTVDAAYGQRQDKHHNPHGEHAHDVWQVRVAGGGGRLTLARVGQRGSLCLAAHMPCPPPNQVLAPLSAGVWRGRASSSSSSSADTSSVRAAQT